MTRSIPHGLTLVETLAASALSVAVLTGAYRALDWAARSQRAGRAQAAGDATLAGALGLLERCIAEAGRTPAPDSIDSALRYASQGGSAATRDAEDAVFNPPARQLVCWGGRESLVLAARVDERDSAATPGASPACAFFRGRSGLAELPRPLQRLIAARLPAANRSKNGLFFVELLAADVLGEEAQPEWQIRRIAALPGEFSRLTLRYLESGRWQPGWAQRWDLMPEAIEISAAVDAGGASVAQALTVAAGGGGAGP
jgi:hypothetical protein